ncbi:MAG: hypothetical protein ACP5XB_16740 [Isosphaeraceae bacterium]
MASSRIRIPRARRVGSLGERCLPQPGDPHRRLTFRHNGIDRRFTDVHGEVALKVLV